MANEPIRLAGLVSVFDQPARQSQVQLLPVAGSVSELLSESDLRYMVVDLQCSASGLRTLAVIRRERPDIRLIVIGPEGDDELAMQSIIAGARAYLDLKAGTKMVRRAIEVVTEGSIWAPHHILSKLIDRLLEVTATQPTVAGTQLTARERQVLELIMTARSNREIASSLGIEVRTVRAHLARLMRKAGVDNRIKLSMCARSLFPVPAKVASRAGSVERMRRPVN